MLMSRNPILCVPVEHVKFSVCVCSAWPLVVAGQQTSPPIEVSSFNTMPSVLLIDCKWIHSHGLSTEGTSYRTLVQSSECSRCAVNADIVCC